MLQYTLTELFEQRTGKSLTLEGYQAIGGVQGVLEQRAEEIYARLGAIHLANSRLTRWFTLDECRQYLHQEQCPGR